MNPNDDVYQYLDGWGGDCTNFVAQALYKGFSDKEMWEEYREILLKDAPPYFAGTANVWTVPGFLREFLLDKSLGEEVVKPVPLAHVNSDVNGYGESALENQVVFNGRNIQPGDVVFYLQDEDLAELYKSLPDSPYVWTHAAMVVDWGAQTYFPGKEKDASIQKPRVVEHSVPWAVPGRQPRSIDNTISPVNYISVVHIKDELPW